MLAEEKLVVMPIYELSIEANTENGYRTYYFN